MRSFYSLLLVPAGGANRNISDQVVNILLHFLELGKDSVYRLDITNLLSPSST